VNHFTDPRFWIEYNSLPEHVRKLADKNFTLLKLDPRHPSLRLKKVGPNWSARVGSDYRALANELPEGLVWFWIGHHSEYDKFLP
jgi:hypothetical protein